MAGYKTRPAYDPRAFCDCLPFSTPPGTQTKRVVGLGRPERPTSSTKQRPTTDIVYRGHSYVPDDSLDF